RGTRGMVAQRDDPRSDWRRSLRPDRPLPGDGGRVRFESVRLRGIGPFRDEVGVDLTELDGPLVAVTGANGAGKSILLGSLLGSVFRGVPTRGSLLDLATDRNAFVE